MADDEQAIRALIAARDAAIAAGDAERAVATTAEGAVAYDLPPPLASTHVQDAVVAGLRDWFATWDGPVTSRLDDPTVRVSGDLAVTFGLARMTGVKKGEGPLDMWFRSTIVLERKRNGWQIVHEHNSVPLEMDGSDKAATDLRSN